MEDRLAFRAENEFRNVTLSSSRTVTSPADRQAAGVSTWRLALLDRLRASTDPMLAQIAAKSVNE